VKHTAHPLSLIASLVLVSSLCACASLGAYFTPQLQSDEATVAADTVTVNNDLLQARADFTSNKAALPADAAKLAVDQTALATAVYTWTQDLKAAGHPAPNVPASTTTALAASAPGA
jgi:hypothetical protein